MASTILKEAEKYFKDNNRQIIYRTSDGHYFDSLGFLKSYCSKNKVKYDVVNRSDFEQKKNKK